MKRTISAADEMLVADVAQNAVSQSIESAKIAIMVLPLHLRPAGFAYFLSLIAEATAEYRDAELLGEQAARPVFVPFSDYVISCVSLSTIVVLNAFALDGLWRWTSFAGAALWLVMPAVRWWRSR